MLCGDTPFYRPRHYTGISSTDEWDVRKTETVGEIHATARVISVKHPRAAA